MPRRFAALVACLAVVACTSELPSPSAASAPTASTLSDVSASETTSSVAAGSSAPGGLTEERAVAVARAAAPQAALWPMLVSTAGTAAKLLHPEGGYRVAQGHAHDRWVWVVVLGNAGTGLDGAGVIVVIDYIDGTVYEVVDLTS
jgi:hypothetical protein